MHLGNFWLTTDTWVYAFMQKVNFSTIQEPLAIHSNNHHQFLIQPYSSLVNRNLTSIKKISLKDYKALECGIMPQ